MRFRYSQEMLAFLAEHYPEKRPAELAEAFNAEFGTEKSASEIRSAVRNHDIKSGRKPGFAKGERYTKWSPEHLEWMRENYPQFTRKDLLERFNEHFGLDRPLNKFIACLTTHHITSGRDGRFAEGQESWNKGKHYQPGGRSVATRFKPGHGGTRTVPMYSERICSKDGYILIKVPEPNPYTKAQSRFKHKHIWIWQQANGPVPDGMLIEFIDGNKLNCDLDNLELVTKAEHLMMNAKHAPKDVPDELRPAARTLAKLKAKAGAMKRQSA